VVVGAGLAGVRTAAELRSAGYAGRLTVLGAETVPPYDRPPLSKAVLLAGAEPDPLAAAWLAGVDLHTGVTVTRIGPGTLATSAGERSWDGLVLATGALPRRLPDSDGTAHVLRTGADAHRLRAALVPGARVVVVGAGWIGAEVATAAAGRGCRVTVLEAGAAPLATALGPVAGACTTDWYGEAGVELRTGAAVAGVEAAGVDLAGGGRVDADVVVEAIGVRPQLGWLDGSGVDVDPASGGVLVDETCAASVPGVVAVGDCAARWSPRAGMRVRTEHWDDALRAPAVAAATLLGAEAASYDPVPYVWSEQFGRYLQWVGWRRSDAPAVWRGDPAAGTGWAAAWLDPDGRVTGMLLVDRQRDAQPARRLIGSDRIVDADRLADPEVPLRSV
jgi:3-phenylpropionate/trans-cinnamate dioxygenase ferredoxin reductase component